MVNTDKPGKPRKVTWNAKSFTKFTLLLIVCSLILAVPLVRFNLSWSMNVSYRLYGDFTRAFHLHSPTMVSFDKNGIPVNDTGYQNGTYLGNQSNPLTIATQSISYYTEYQKNHDAKTEESFFSCIVWLEENGLDKGDYDLWGYNFPLSTYNASAPWYSAMAQARIMVAFQKAYELTGEEKYSQFSVKAMRALEVPIENGGVTRVDSVNGGKWYEEVAGGGSPPSYILNGFIFSLLDLNEYYVETGSTEAKSLFDDGIIELKIHLQDYDTGHWTYYDRIGHLAYDYHYVHIDQMKRLFQITGDTEFSRYEKHWASYFPINPLWARQRFAAYLFDSVLIFLGLVVIFSLYKLYELKIRKHALKD